MPKKGGIPSKATRFEVFKRDSFRCLYCGRGAPEVVLHLDHVDPRSKGGAESVLNYATACADCNLGKGARRISDTSVVEVQRKQLDDLQERREQLAMMVAWRDSLANEEDVTLGVVEKAIDRWCSVELTHAERSTLRKLVRRVGLEHTLAAVDVASDLLDTTREGSVSAGAFERFLAGVGRIANMKKRSEGEPGLERVYYARGVLRKRFDLDFEDADAALSRLREVLRMGVNPEWLVDTTKRVENMEHFYIALDRAESEAPQCT